MATTELGAANQDRIRILGLPVDCVTMDQTLARLEAFLKSDQTHLVVTANAAGLFMARSDPVFGDLVKGAELVTPDGMGVLWAAKQQGVLLSERVTGVDIVDRICILSADKGYRVYFLGAESGVAELAAEKLRLKHPGCNIVGTHDGYFPPESDEVVASEIAESKPDILLVAMGMPRQEQFIRSTEQIIRAKVAMGVGGSFDVFSGRVKRAPVIVQRLAMEWFWRFIQDRRKIAKALMVPRFMLLVLRERR